MYRVIGTDGREYGPVRPELLRDWIGEGRVNAATLICAEGSLDWRPLGSLAEFRPFMDYGLPLHAVARQSPRGHRQTNGWAISGFLCGLLSPVLGFCCCCCLPLDLFGIVFCVIALVQISNNPDTQTGTALAIVGLILSLSSFMLGLVFSTLWISTGAAEGFLRELEREFRLGPGSLLLAV